MGCDESCYEEGGESGNVRIRLVFGVKNHAKRGKDYILPPPMVHADILSFLRVHDRHRPGIAVAYGHPSVRLA